MGDLRLCTMHSSVAVNRFCLCVTCVLLMLDTKLAHIAVEMGFHLFQCLCKHCANFLTEFVLAFRACPPQGCRYYPELTVTFGHILSVRSAANPLSHASTHNPYSSVPSHTEILRAPWCADRDFETDHLIRVCLADV